MTTSSGRVDGKRERAAPLLAGLVVAASVAAVGCQRGAGVEWNDGVVKEIFVKAGDPIQTGTALISVG